MEKNRLLFLKGLLMTILLGSSLQVNAAGILFGDATFYHKISYGLTGAGTVYANGPEYNANTSQNGSRNFDKVTSSSTTATAKFSKNQVSFLSTPTSVNMFYSLIAENTNSDYQFDHWEKRNGNSWVTIASDVDNPLKYTTPEFSVRQTNSNPSVSDYYRGVFVLKGILKAEVDENQTDIGGVYNSKVNNTVGDEVTLTASSNASFQGVTFDYWTIDEDPSYKSTVNPLTVTVPDVESITYRAHFTQPDGFSYCRFENVGTGKFLSLSNLRRATIKEESSGNGTQYTALIIHAFVSEDKTKGIGDPSTVFYIGGTSDGHNGLTTTSVLQAQDVDVLKTVLVDGNNKEYALKMTKQGQYYRISTTMTLTSDGDQGTVYLRDEGSAITFTTTEDNNSLWKVHFLDEDHFGEHAFGISPDSRMYKQGKYYSTLYTTFPYRLCDGMKAYYLNLKDPNIYDEQTKKITFNEIPQNGIVSKKMAVILECNGTEPSGNRILPIIDPRNEIGDVITDKINLLKGALVVGGSLTGAQAATKNNLPNQDYVYVYSSKDGWVSFYKWSGDKALPNNKCYLAVTKDFEGEESADGNAAKGYTLVFGNDKEEFTGIDRISAEVKSEFVYDLQGRKVSNPNAGVYIKNGKKIVVK